MLNKIWLRWFSIDSVERCFVRLPHKKNIVDIGKRNVKTLRTWGTKGTRKNKKNLPPNKIFNGGLFYCTKLFLSSFCFLRGCYVFGCRRTLFPSCVKSFFGRWAKSKCGCFRLRFFALRLRSTTVRRIDHLTETTFGCSELQLLPFWVDVGFVERRWRGFALIFCFLNLWTQSRKDTKSQSLIFR